MWATDIGLFVAIVTVTYGLTVAVYLAVGCFFELLNRRHPERRIQSRPATFLPMHEIGRAVAILGIVAVCFGGGVFVQSIGWALAPLELTVLSGIGMFIASVILNDTWFYLTHRLLHMKPFYRLHKRHHSCVTPSVWSNDYFSAPDIFIQHVYFFFVPFILPIPLEVLIAHRLYDQIKGMAGHCGFEYFAGRLSRWPFPFASTHFHDRHHEKFTCNFANTLTIWDRIFGTIDHGYDRTIRDYSPSAPVISQTKQMGQ